MNDREGENRREGRGGKEGGRDRIVEKTGIGREGER